jgi:hypothetical protein
MSFHSLVSKFLQKATRKNSIAGSEQSHKFDRKRLSLAALEATLSVETSFHLEEEEDARDDHGDQRIEYSECARRRSKRTDTAVQRDSSDGMECWLRKSHPTVPDQLTASQHLMEAVFFDTTTVDVTPEDEETQQFPPPVFLAESHSFSMEIIHEKCDDLDLDD